MHMVSRFHSVVVITSALHAEGPGFEPQWNHDLFCPDNPLISNLMITVY